MAVPYTFGSATTSIPLSQLDSNFATPITLGNTAVQLGNTVTTLNNMTLANVTVSSAATPIPEAAGGTGSTVGWNDFKNRIINGAMVIDQRNAGAAVTPSGTETYTVDRFSYIGTQASKFTFQQNAASITPPVGFANYLGFTVASAVASPAAGDQFAVYHKIEGLNCSDLAFGSANASTVTVSFWVRSSLTGTFSGGLVNSAGNRSYVFNYTISAANTWEQKTVTIAGDTTGTWLTTNGIGIQLRLDLGSGLNQEGTVNAWQAADKMRTSGSVRVVSTASATFYITGVQLEKGSTATSFGYRPYGEELYLAQRYYYRVSPDNNSPFGVGPIISGTQAYICVPFPTTMRITPTAVEQNGTASNYRLRWSAGGTVCSSVVSFVNGSPSSSFVIFTVAAGLTAGQAAFGETNAAGAYLGWSAEL